MKKVLPFLIMALAGCTSFTIVKPDGTRICGGSFLNDINIPQMTFSTTRPTTGPSSSETFTLSASQAARLEAVNKALDLLGKIP